MDGAFAGGAWGTEGTFTVPAVPVGVDDAVSRNAGQTLKIPVATLLANDPAPAGPVLTVTGVDATSAGGASVLLADGFYSGDTFHYTFSDGTHTDTALVTVTVVPPSDTPTRNIVQAALVSGVFKLAAAGIPCGGYQLQSAASLTLPVARD